ncbi:MAG: hypothetical protein L3K26_02190 [Candidatus Hydrogenedentes bacterium]|nr:hypothetical protein [Candidatus Hydrogenedentota bacterium]
MELETATWKETIGLGHTNVVSLDARGDKLYLGTRESVGLQMMTPMTAYYLQELDVPNGTEGPSVNVPGAFLDYDSQQDLLTLLDHQWGFQGAVKVNLETVRWSGDQNVAPLASLELPEYSYNHQGGDGRVYFESYEEGAALYQVTVGNDGAMSLSAPADYGTSYGNLIDVTGDHAFVSVAGSAIAHYTFADGIGTLTQRVELTGYPSTVRVDNSAVYLPLGYYGLLTLPL